MAAGGNKDITTASTYWKNIDKDTTPFGSMPGHLGAGGLDDERFRLMDPGSQAAVRSARTATA